MVAKMAEMGASASGSEPDISCQNMICAVCHEEIGAIRPDGFTEIEYLLPCSHVFGNLCILRWLQVSSRQDCPHCRRSMIHPGCGHLIMPHDSTTAPPSIPENETPKLCLRCRGEGPVATALRYEHGRLQAQEAALRGLQSHLPMVFGGLAVKGSCTVDERIAELRREYAIFHEKIWTELAETERRERW